jgi:antitoxin (DNA-binding transcriptional repressor) of toxin-antitoxin stability system
MNMRASVRELRNSMKLILGAVQHGEEVIIYSREQAIARIVPINTIDDVKQDYGFGMWCDDADKKNVAKYVRKLRKGRIHDF